MKYRYHSVIVEAIQWNGKNFNEIRKFTGNCSGRCWLDTADNVVWLNTLDGCLGAVVNDFIVKEVGYTECYRESLSTFKAEYKKVEETIICTECKRVMPNETFLTERSCVWCDKDDAHAKRKAQGLE